MTIGALLLAAALALVFLFVFDPTVYTFYPKCPFFALTGLKCPGCGTTRALHALIHLDFAAACSFNPFLFVGIAYVVCTVASERLRKSRVFAQVVLWTTLLYWIARNL